MSLEPFDSSISELERSRSVTGQHIESLMVRAAESPTSIGPLLEACRSYLLVVASDELASDVRAKVASSDLVQQSLIEAYQGFDGFHGTTAAELLAWLRRVLINNVVDATRGFRATGKRAISREVSIEANTSGVGLAGALVDAEPSPFMHAVASEESERLFHMLMKLNSRDQQVIRLRNWEQISFAEIGRQLETTEEAARKLWTRAVQRLARELKVSHDDNSV